MVDKDYVKALEQTIAEQDLKIKDLEKTIRQLWSCLHSEKVRHGQTKAHMRKFLQGV